MNKLEEIRKEYNEAHLSLFEVYKKKIEKLVNEDWHIKVGDTIEDDYGKGKVLKIGVRVNNLLITTLYYECSNLTKTGDINKKAPIRIIYNPE